MRGIGRVLGAILLAGAVAGAAAFAHGLAGGPETGRFTLAALPPAPASPLVVQAQVGPPLEAGPIAPPAPSKAHVATAPRAQVLASVVTHARPIVIAPIPQASAHHHRHLPVPPDQAPATPATPPAATPPVPTPAPTPAPTPPVRVIASVQPIVTTAAPVQQQGQQQGQQQPTGREHDHGHQGHDQSKHDSGNAKGNGKKDDHSDDSGPTVLAAVPLQPAPTPASVPTVGAPAAVTTDPSATGDAQRADNLLGDDHHDGHDQGDDHGHDHWGGHGRHDG